MNEKRDAILIPIITTFIFIIVVIYIKSDIFHNPFNLFEDVTTPIVETPPIVTNPSKVVHSKELLDSPFTPSSNPYGSAYLTDAIRLTLGGKFESIVVRINGEVIGDGYRFISFNFGLESGILNAVRKSESQLDINKTLHQGGAYNKIISASVDLLQEVTIGSNKNDFQKLGGTKKIKFWDKIGTPLPTVVPLLVAPFTEKGTYGGAAINSIKLDYVCDGTSMCSVNICPTGKKTTQCLDEQFGVAARQAWCKNTNQCD